MKKSKTKNGGAFYYSLTSDTDYSDMINVIKAQGFTKSRALDKILKAGYMALKAIGAQTSEQTLFSGISEEMETTTTTTTTTTKRNRVIGGNIPQNSCRYYTNDKGSPLFLSFPGDFAKEVQAQGYREWAMQKIGNETCITLSKCDMEGGKPIGFGKAGGEQMRLSDGKRALVQFLGEPKREGEIWTTKCFAMGDMLVLCLSK